MHCLWSTGWLVLSDPRVLDKTVSAQWKIIKGVLLHQTILKRITEIILVIDTKYKEYSKYQRSKSSQIKSIHQRFFFVQDPPTEFRERKCMRVPLALVLVPDFLHSYGPLLILYVQEGVAAASFKFFDCQYCQLWSLPFFFQLIVSTLHAPRSAVEADKFWPKPVIRRSG